MVKGLTGKNVSPGLAVTIEVFLTDGVTLVNIDRQSVANNGIFKLATPFTMEPTQTALIASSGAVGTFAFTAWGSLLQP